MADLAISFFISFFVPPLQDASKVAESRPHRCRRRVKYALNPELYLSRRPGFALALAIFDPHHSLSTAFLPMLTLLRRVSSFKVTPVRVFSTTRSNAAPSNSIQELAELVEETQSRLEEAEHEVQQFSSST